jgi:hypothetical protein
MESADVEMEPAADWADGDDWEAADGEEWEAAGGEEWEAAGGEDWDDMDGVDWEAFRRPEDVCILCGMPSWFPPWPYCEACDRAIRNRPIPDDDATTASGDPPEELSDEDDWQSVYELEDR